MTQGCSVALISSVSTRPAASPNDGLRRSLAASVAPDVKTTARASAPSRAAISARARSMIARAARPSSWTDEALPHWANASAMASRAAGRKGAEASAMTRRPGDGAPMEAPPPTPVKNNHMAFLPDCIAGTAAVAGVIVTRPEEMELRCPR